MFANDFNFKKDLAAHHIYSSWQFIQYTQKNIEIVKYCFNTINSLIQKMTIKTVKWEQDLFTDFVEEEVKDGKTYKKVNVTVDNSPVYEVRVAGEKTNPWFLFDKLLRDFYQYAMNSLDSISQVANSGLLANKAKKVDAVDFQRMAACFTQQTYRASFPKTSAWFKNIAASPEFQYIEAINNRTKHTADISNKLAMGILGGSNKTEIGPFFRKDIPHKKRELSDQLLATLDFLEQSWNDFLLVFCEEYILDRYNDSRRNTIGGVYQQSLKNERDQDLVYAYIDVENNFESMPDEIYILLVKVNDEVYAHECPFDTILVRGGNEYEIVGRYVVEESIGDDCLLHYRKYIKDNEISGQVCLFYEMKGKIQTFYHSNPFFEVKTISDDNALLMRTSLPL